MYKLMAVISILVRQFYIPNPFEVLGDGLVVNVGDTLSVLSPEVLNWMATLFLPAVTYTVVGLYYDRGSNPALGSFLYLLFYCVHTLLLWLVSLAGFAIWAVALTLVLYVGCLVMLKTIRPCHV